MNPMNLGALLALGMAGEIARQPAMDPMWIDPATGKQMVMGKMSNRQRLLYEKAQRRAARQSNGAV